MIAAGLDIGGSKMAAHLFDADWQVADSRRVATPDSYDAFIAALAALVVWARDAAGAVPIGVGMAGRVSTVTGLGLAANLPITGRPVLMDIAAAAGPVPVINDAAALALSESVFGAGRGANPVLGLVLGTGVSGAVTVGGQLIGSGAGLAGELGHTPVPARWTARAGVVPERCGCGRVGCIENWLAAPGLRRLSTRLTGRSVGGRDFDRTDPVLGEVWTLWCDLAAELILSATLTVDPEMVVIGGGLSKLPGLVEDVTAALVRLQWDGFGLPTLRLAEGGSDSGARGAAWHARSVA